MARVYVLIGKIASGKTTLARRICEQEPAEILSGDDVMLNLFDGCLGPKHHQAMTRNIHEYFMTLIPTLLKQEISCILENGYWTKLERVQIKHMLEEIHCQYQMIYLDVPQKLRYEWLSNRNKELSNATKRQFIITKEQCMEFDQRFEEPDEEEAIYIKDITSNRS